MFNSLVLTWERNFGVTFDILSVLVFHISVLESYLDILDVLHDYCQDWKLNVNLKKTKAMVFSNKLRKHNKLSFTFNNKALETVSQFTYLGVTINSTG